MLYTWSDMSLCKEAASLRDTIRSGMYKIGHTTNISGRLKSFQTGHPIDMEVIYSRTLHKNIKAESILHRRYKKNQLKGEWFQIEDIQECIDFINSL